MAIGEVFEAVSSGRVTQELLLCSRLLRDEEATLGSISVRDVVHIL